MQSRRSYKTVAIQSSLFNIFRILRPKAEILLQKVFCRHHRRPLTGNAHDKRTNSKLQVCFTSDKNTPASFIYVLFPTIPFRLFSLSFPACPGIQVKKIIPTFSLPENSGRGWGGFHSYSNKTSSDFPSYSQIIYLQTFQFLLS